MNLKNLYGTVVLLLALAIAAPKFSIVEPLPLAPLADLTGQNIVITGGNSGVGLEAAKSFVTRGANIIITSRSAVRASSACAGITGSVGGCNGFPLDLQSPSSIAAFAAMLNELPRVDALLLNAGTIYGPDYRGPYTVTEFPGGEVASMIAANHLGHFKIVIETLSLLEKSGARVVFTSSISHHLGDAESVTTNLVNPTVSLPDTPLSFTQSLRAFKLYGSTKLMNALTANRLSTIAPSLKVTLVTPGFTATAIGSSDRSPDVFNPMNFLPLTFSPADGAAPLIAAAEPGFDAARAANKMLQPYWIWDGAGAVLGNGMARGVFHNLVQEVLLQKLSPGLWLHEQSEVAKNTELQERLWEWSSEMVK